MRQTTTVQLATVAPSALANPTVAAVGTGSSAMRSDALFGIPTPATPSTQAFGDTATSGAGTGFATDTHKHAMPADPHVEAKVTAGAAASESVTWTTAYSATPVVVCGTVNASPGYGCQLTARSTTGATVLSYYTVDAGSLAGVKQVIGRSAT